MEVYKITQGAKETIHLPLSIDPNALTGFVVTIQQDGEQRLYIPSSRCIIDDNNDVVFTLTQAETLSLSPNRCGINFRGLLAGGNTYLMREIPCEIVRTKFTSPLT